MSEAAEIKRDQAKAQKNSGRGAYQKGDAILDIFTVDYKEYEKSFSISKEVWGKICSDSIRNRDTEPLIKVILGGTNNRTRLGVVSWEIIEDYIRLRKAEEDAG